MKILLLILLISSFFAFSSSAQDVTPAAEQQLESLTDAEQSETEDDSYLLQLEQYKKNPINLNTAEASELKELRILTDLQINNFISYRSLLGEFISIYELQAVPAWDINTLHKLLPFLTIASSVSLKDDLFHRLRKGDHSLLLRYTQVLGEGQRI